MGLVAVVLLEDAEESLDLAAGDGKGRRGGEARDNRYGDEVYEETKLEDSEEEDDDSREEGEENGVVGSESFEFSLLEDIAGHDSHDGSGTDGDVLDTAEDAVHEAAHEGRVEPVLRGKVGHDGIGDTLGDDGETHGDTSDGIGDGVVHIVLGQPLYYGDLLLDMFEDLVVVVVLRPPSHQGYLHLGLVACLGLASI